MSKYTNSYKNHGVEYFDNLFFEDLENFKNDITKFKRTNKKISLKLKGNDYYDNGNAAKDYYERWNNIIKKGLKSCSGNLGECELKKAIIYIGISAIWHQWFQDSNEKKVRNKYSYHIGKIRTTKPAYLKHTEQLEKLFELPTGGNYPINATGEVIYLNKLKIIEILKLYKDLIFVRRNKDISENFNN